MKRLVFALAVASCAAPAEEGPRRGPPRPPGMEESPYARGRAVAPGLQITVAAPEAAYYNPAAFGIGGQRVAVTLKNTGVAPVKTEPLEVYFTASREGVAFRCADVPSAIEPRPMPSMPPGETASYDVLMDCALALPGRYEINVFVKVGAEASPRERVSTFAFRVDGGRATTPKPYPGKEGLFTAMAGEPMVRAAETKAKGKYPITVALINAGTRSLALGAGRLTFRAYKKGQALPCSEGAVPVDMPTELRPGAIHFVRGTAQCVLGAEGEYEMVGLIGFGEAADREVGRFFVRVTSDPNLLVPLPK